MEAVHEQWLLVAESLRGILKPTVEFTVLGEQRPQGSKITHVVFGRDGQLVRSKKTGRPIAVCRNDNPHLEAWRQEVGWAARRVYTGPLWEGPVFMFCLLIVPRPHGHYGTGKNAHVLKPSAPVYPGTKPDSFKLVRAIEDAMSGVVYADDSQIVHHLIGKVYGQRHETLVIVHPIQVTQPPVHQPVCEAQRLLFQ